MDTSKKDSPLLTKLVEKGNIKHKAYSQTKSSFEQLKTSAQEMMSELRGQVDKQNTPIPVGYKDLGDFTIWMRFGGEILIAHMHSNVFHFSKHEAVMKTSYVKKDISRSYVGVITIYNFISDSFKYNRIEDIGYLVARIFINGDNHYFVEGKRQIGLLYNTFDRSVMNKESIKEILESAVSYSLDFDLLVQPYDYIKEVSVNEMQNAIQSTRLKTGKRLGFKFNADHEKK